MTIRHKKMVSITMATVLPALAGIAVTYFVAWALRGSQTEAVRALIVIIPAVLAVAVVTQLVARRKDRALE